MPSWNSHWGLYRLLDCHSFRKPCSKSEVSEPVLSGHFMPAKSFSFVGEKNVVSFISNLLRTCFPPAVRGLVVSIIIHSSYGKFFRGSFSHVFEKFFKRFFPSVTYFYASSSIVMKFWIVWIKASLPNITPDSIFCSRRISPRKSVRYSFLSHFFFKTAARFSKTRLEITSDYLSLNSAFATTNPEFRPSYFGSSGKSKHGPPTEYFSSDIRNYLDWSAFFKILTFSFIHIIPMVEVSGNKQLHTVLFPRLFKGIA